MPLLYLDVFSGISGDMFVGAMLDLGVPLERLGAELRKLELGGYHLHVTRATKSGIAGVKFDVHLTADEDHAEVRSAGAADENLEGHADLHEHHHSHAHHHHHHHHHHHQEDAHGREEHHHHGSEPHHGHGRTFREIRELIGRSGLSDWVKTRSISVFQRIALAEGKIHGQSPDDVHFHEVGAIDSIVDITAATTCLELLGQPRVLAGPVVEGTGWVRCAHGQFPLPAPATLEILGARGIALSQCEEPAELVTPTGAALLAEFAESFAPMQGLVARRVGYGLGTRENRTRPNVVRAVLGELEGGNQAAAAQSADAVRHDWESDTIAVLETNLDDMNPEILGQFVDAALAAGAVDVFHTPIQMKKNRPGVLLSVLCAGEAAERFSEMILRHTTAFGVRQTLASRRKLRRELRTVPTPYGQVTVKVGWLDGVVLHAAPEFESCRALAAQARVAVRLVMQSAAAAAQGLVQKGPAASKS